LTDLILALQVIQPSTKDCGMVLQEVLVYVVPLGQKFHDDFKSVALQILKNYYNHSSLILVDQLSFLRNIIQNQDFQAGTNLGSSLRILLEGIIQH